MDITTRAISRGLRGLKDEKKRPKRRLRRYWWDTI